MVSFLVSSSLTPPFNRTSVHAVVVAGEAVGPILLHFVGDPTNVAAPHGLPGPSFLLRNVSTVSRDQWPPGGCVCNNKQHIHQTMINKHDICTIDLDTASNRDIPMNKL